MTADWASQATEAPPLHTVKTSNLQVRPVVLKYFVHRIPIFLEIRKDSKDLFFMWVVSTDIYYIRN